MAPKPTPPQKKQQSLTSFFTPRTVNGLAATLQKAQAAKQAAAEEPRKRPLEEDPDKGNNGPEKSTKRAKGDPVDNGESTFFAPAARTGSSPAPPQSYRTERYVYDESGSHGGMTVEEEEEDAAARRKKEDLHRRFVKKLGHPDSMLRRRAILPEESNGAGEDDEADGGEAEDDEPPPPPKTKAKGGARANKKLTPLEIQYLDIKRKHMDTILIVEVGYKFRFFGDDARIAAKELSIVCIPGKFRYDERRLSSLWYSLAIS
jgi:DNA mismatch repair protein MSH3